MKCSRCGYEPSGKNRSLSQNKYYWGCVVQIISDELGYTKDEVHEIIKHRFLSENRIIKGKTGEVHVSLSKSTTELDTKQWEDLMSQIRIWASQTLGIYIMEPNEQINNENI